MTAIFYWLAAVFLASEPMPEQPVLIINDNPPTWSVFIPDELVKDDAIVEFVERVNARAIASPLWKTDYKAAHYYAFCDEANDYALNKYRAQQR